MKSTLKEIEEWFASQCDGDWEHGQGIKIETLDNPGWRISINLEDTPLQDRPFKELRHNYDNELDWMRCWKNHRRFEAVGGPRKLEDMLQAFIQWAKSNEKI